MEPTARLSHRDLGPGGRPGDFQTGLDGRPLICNPSPALGRWFPCPGLLTVGPLPPVGWEWGGGSQAHSQAQEKLSEHHTSLSSISSASPLLRARFRVFCGRAGSGVGRGLSLGMDGVLPIPPLDHGVSQQRKAHAEDQESSGPRGLVSPGRTSLRTLATEVLGGRATQDGEAD